MTIKDIFLSNYIGKNNNNIKKKFKIGKKKLKTNTNIIIK